MSRRYNTKHNRVRSRYPQRLKKRGLTSVSVRMASLSTLRRRQGARDEEVAL